MAVPEGGHTPATAARGVEYAFGMLEGRWKMLILFHLFDGKVLRFSELERAIPAITQKMLIQQLRQLEADGIVRRIQYAQVPPKVEYCLTPWGQALCPALDAFLKWAARREELLEAAGPPQAPVAGGSAGRRAAEHAPRPGRGSSTATKI